MNFDEFVNFVNDNIVYYITVDDVEKIEIKEVRKNNGCIFTGMMMKVKGHNAQPNIYLEPHYYDYINGKQLADVMKDISKSFSTAYENLENVIEEFYTRDQAIEKVYLKLINYNKNKDMLISVPYIPFHDLALTFWCLVENDEKGVSSFLVSNEHMMMWELNTDELYKYAKKNTIDNFSIMFMRLDKMLEKMSAPYCDEEVPELIDLYVLTNKQNINGSALITYKDILEDISSKLGGDYYIIPSSVNEVLIVSKDNIVEKEYIEDLVKQVNKEVVSATDFLSDTVYFYNSKTKAIEI